MSPDALPHLPPALPDRALADDALAQPDAQARRYGGWLYRVALVAGPLAAALLSTAPRWSASRVPTGVLADPVVLFVVLINLFFCLPYLSAFAFAYVRRREEDRVHTHAVLFSLLSFGMIVLWGLALVTSPR